MLATTSSGGHGTSSSSKIPICDGTSSSAALEYLRHIKPSIDRHLATQSKPISLTALFSMLGDGFPLNSATHRWLSAFTRTSDGIDLHLPETPLIQQLYLLEYAAWVFAIDSYDEMVNEDFQQEEFARRMSIMISTLHPDDLKAEPLRFLQTYVVNARASWYDANPHLRPVVKGVDDQGNPVPGMQLPTDEQARLDKYDSATMEVVAQAIRFKFQPLVHPVTYGRFLDRLNALELSEEFRDCNRVIREQRLDRVNHLRRFPTPLEFIITLFRAQFCQPRSTDVNRLKKLRFQKTQGIATFIAQFRSLHELVRHAPHLAPSPQAVYQFFLLAVRDADPAACQYLRSWAQANLPDERDRTVERLYPQAQQYFDEQLKLDDQAASSGLRSTSPAPTPASPRPTSTNTYRRPPAISPASRAPSYAADFTPHPTPGSPPPTHQPREEYHYCSICCIRHGTICFCMNPDQAYPSWNPPRDGLGAEVYRARCEELGIRPRGYSHRDSRYPVSSGAQHAAAHSNPHSTPRPSAAPSTRFAPRSTVPTTSQNSTPATDFRSRANTRSNPKTATSNMAAGGEWSWASEEEGDPAHFGCLMADEVEPSAHEGQDGADPAPMGESCATTRAQMRAAADREAPIPPPAHAHTHPAAVPLVDRPPVPAPVASPAPVPAAPAPRAAAAAEPSVPAVLRRPAPVPFGATSIPRNIAPSQLPDTTRTARQRLLDQHRTLYERAPVPVAAAAPAAAPAFCMSFTQLLSLGPQILEQALSAAPRLLVHGLSILPTPVSADSISIDISTMSEAGRRQLLTAYTHSLPASPAVPAPPAAAAAVNMAADAPLRTIIDYRPLNDMLQQQMQSVSTDEPSTSNPATAAAAAPPAAPAGPAPFSSAIPDWNPWSQDAPASPTAAAASPTASDASAPSLLSLPDDDYVDSVGHGTAATVAMAQAYHPNAPPPAWQAPRSCIFALCKNPSQSAILTHMDTGAPCLPPTSKQLHTIVDSGSTLNLILRKAAIEAGLQWDSTNPLRMTTSSGSVAATLGVVTTPVAVTLCHDDPNHRTSIMLDLHVVDSNNPCYELLLGTQWLTALGARLDVAAPSTLTFFPSFPSRGIKGSAVTVPLITTV